MPAELIRKGQIFYIEGTIRVGKTSVRVRETTGRRDEASARVIYTRRCAEIVEQLLRGEDPGMTKVPGFATAAANYEEFKRIIDKKPLGNQDRKKLVTLGEYFGEKPVNTIVSEDWDDFVATKLDDPAPATVRRWFAMFKPPLKRIEEQFKFTLPKFVLPAEGKLREIFLEPEDRDGLLAAYAEHAREIALMLCLQGCRHFEAVRLNWSDVSFARNTLTFRVTKNGEVRVVPMHPEVRAALEQMHRGQQSGPVFLTPEGKPYVDRRAASHGDGTDGSGIRTAHASALRRFTLTKLMDQQVTCRHCDAMLLAEPGEPGSPVVQLALVRSAGEREEGTDYALSCARCDDANPPASPAKINWFRIHDWRHHWASWLIMDGGDAPSLMALGGWKDPKMVQRYVKLSVKHLETKLAQSQRRQV